MFRKFSVSNPALLLAPKRYAQCLNNHKMTINKYPHTDKIQIILEGKADFVKRDGLNYLIPAWQKFADNYVDTEDSIFEWHNDLDTRNIIDEILALLPTAEKTKVELDLKVIDAKVIEKTFEINECVWGDQVEHDNKYNRQNNWYYYRMNQSVFNSETGQYTKRQ